MANEIAYGFVNLQDIFTDVITDQMVPTIQTAIEESYRLHNEQVSLMLGELVSVTTEFKLKYELPGAGESQPLDEHGNPLVSKPSGSYEIAFPIKGAGNAWGDNRVSRAHMTVQKANSLTLDSMAKDLRWLRRNILAALFTNTPYIYPDDEHDDLTIRPLANGDSVTYVRSNGSVSSDTHYLTQTNAIGASNNPYPTIYTELNEHPSNAGPYVAYIASNLVTATEALASFHEVTDADIIYGSGITRANVSVDTDVTVRNHPMAGIGNRVLGKVDGLWAVEWESLPDNYIIGLARGADQVLAMREYVPASLRGYFPENFSPDGNHLEHRGIRYAGFGARNRVGAVIMQIETASYAIPTGYDASAMG